MDDRDLRLECLRLAVQAQMGEPVREAGRLYEFVTGIAQNNLSSGAKIGAVTGGAAVGVTAQHFDNSRAYGFGPQTGAIR